MTTIRTARLVGTPVSDADLPDLVEFLFDPQIKQWLHPPEIPHELTEERIGRWVTKAMLTWQQRGAGYWIWRDADGAFVGRSGIDFPALDGPDDVELGWAIAPTHWRQGLALETAVAAREFAFSHFDTDSIIAFTLPHNVASRGVMTALGMTYERDITWAGLPHVLYRLPR